MVLRPTPNLEDEYINSYLFQDQDIFRAYWLLSGGIYNLRINTFNIIVTSQN
jgi:hypothetical protein